MFFRDLERFWPSHGLLVIPSNFDDNLETAGLDGDRIGQLRTFLMREGHRKIALNDVAEFDWTNILSWATLQEYSSQFDLALLQETRAAYFDLVSDDQFCIHDPQNIVPIEVTRGYHGLYTCCVKEIEDLEKRSIPKEEPPDQVWRKRFRGHAMHSTSVAVIDKYAVRRDFKGLRLFLKKLVTDGWQSAKNVQTVDIYSTYRAFSGSGPESSLTIKSALEEYGRQLSRELGSRLPKVHATVKLLREKDMEHDRWIRFDSNVIELSSGLSALESERRQAYGFVINDGDDARFSEEVHLRSICKARTQNDAVFLRILLQ